MTTVASDNRFPKIIGVEQASDPAAPAAGERKFYPKADGWYDEDSAGTVTKVGAGTGDVSTVAGVSPTAGDVPAADLATALEPTLDDTFVESVEVRSMVKLTQAAYDLLTPDASTLYVIVG